MGFKKLAEYERAVVFNWNGRFGGVIGPGLVYVSPGKTVRDIIDLRETVEDIPHQDCITSDNVPVQLNPIVFYKITDPEKTVLSVTNAKQAIMSLTRTTLRAVVGDMVLADVISKREDLASQLRARLSAEAERWGIYITTVEIAALTLQPDVEAAMTKRKAELEQAEASRKATIMKAEAELEASRSQAQAIQLLAEADKNAAIAKAEGEKQVQILRAEGMRVYYQSLIELGEGAEIALKFENIAATKTFGESQNAKLIIIPSEMRGINSAEIGAISQLKWAEEVIPSKKEG